MNMVHITDLIDDLAEYRLLRPEQYQEFCEQMLPQCQEPTILLWELLYRGWLTRYQVEKILTGRAASLRVGSSYVLLEPLGEGGMGRVFRVWHANMEKLVAIKFLRCDKMRHPAIVARFQREFCAMRQLNHPNIVKAYDAGQHGATFYYAMEYVAGRDLEMLVRHEGPLSLSRAIRYIIQTAHALQYAHERGLVHRDVKPSNLLHSDSTDTIKLLDLGLTRSEVAANDSIFREITEVGMFLGTPDFISPEQITDGRRVDIRADLYSLGCTFYFLLTGRAPFEHINHPFEKLHHHCNEPPPPIEQFRPDVSGPLSGIFTRLLAKDPDQRFATPTDLVQVLLELEEMGSPRKAETIANISATTICDIELPVVSSGNRTYVTEVMPLSPSMLRDSGSPAGSHGSTQLSRIIPLLSDKMSSEEP